MNQENIHEFWNLQGVIGISLIHGSTEPKFYFKTEIIDWEKQALIPIILQSISKFSDKFDSFEFEAMGYHAYTYRFSHKITFLALTYNEITSIKIAAKQLKPVIEKDINKAISTFEQLSQEVTAQANSKMEGRKIQAVRSTSTMTSVEMKVTLEELITVLNQLSKFSCNYMGPKVTASYWQATCPNVEWLKNFQINQSAKITFSGVITEHVTLIQHQLIQKWTAAFIRRCSYIIQDLPTLIEQKCLNEREKKLLLIF